MRSDWPQGLRENGTVLRLSGALGAWDISIARLGRSYQPVPALEGLAVRGEPPRLEAKYNGCAVKVSDLRVPFC
jgi:hypothetical protein